MVTHFKFSLLFMACSFCVCTGIAQAQTNVSELPIAEAKVAISNACPLRWETLSEKLVVPSTANENVWQDAADRTAFIEHITNVLAESEIDANPSDLADDANAVAAECASARTVLLDLLLIKEPNDIILGMRSIKGALTAQSLSSKDGSSQTLAATSCHTIKQAFPDSEDGVYWLDFTAGNYNDAQQVYCDMSTDGGGWTFVAFLTDKQEISTTADFFNQAYGTYNVSRVGGDNTYSLGVLPQLADTEMLIVLEYPDPEHANNHKRLLHLKYDKNSPALNYGPIPCTPTEVGISNDITNVDFVLAEFATSVCDGKSWGLKTYDTVSASVASRNVMTIEASKQGAKAQAFFTNHATNEYHRKAWFYVR